jgi:uncharacterized protein YjiS (DUF1127 family)
MTTAEIDRRTNLTGWWSASIGTAAAVMTRGAGLLVAAIRGRRELSRLADRDDRMLADIGLTRSDLHDAHSEPLWRDPTAMLSQRVSCRRAASEPHVGAHAAPSWRAAPKLRVSVPRIRFYNRGGAGRFRVHENFSGQLEKRYFAGEGGLPSSDRPQAISDAVAALS